MAFEKSQRETIWRNYFGSAYSANDCFGRYMTIDNFEADHIWPESIGGRNHNSNGQPLSAQSNQEKADNTTGTINGNRFEVRKSGFNGIGVMYVNGNRVSKPIVDVTGL